MLKYNSVGDKDSKEYFSSFNNEVVEECINPYFNEDGSPALQDKCIMYVWYNTNKPRNREEIIDGEASMIEDCNIFYHLAESKELDENGNPVFQSMKFWGGDNDFSYPEFKYIPELQIWSADSCGGEMYFEWTAPFIYHDDAKTF